MIVTVAAFKGGVAKTTTAIHVATYLARCGSGGEDDAGAGAGAPAATLLIDGDPNRSATGWAKRGGAAGADGRPSPLPFRVVDERQAARYVPAARHIVIDTPARPSREDLEALVDGCDLLVLPTTPDALALDALLATVETLRELQAERYRVLLTVVPPRPSRDGEEARALIREAGLPLFDAEVGRLSAFTKASLLGVPVCGVPGDPRASRAWDQYVAVGKEILP